MGNTCASAWLWMVLGYGWCWTHVMVIEVEDRYEMMTSPVRTKNVKTHDMNHTNFNLRWSLIILNDPKINWRLRRGATLPLDSGWNWTGDLGHRGDFRWTLGVSTGKGQGGARGIHEIWGLALSWVIHIYHPYLFWAIPVKCHWLAKLLMVFYFQPLWFENVQCWCSEAVNLR